MSISTWISLQHFWNNFWKKKCVMHTLQYEHVLTFWCDVTYLYISVIRIRIRIFALPIKGPQGANNLIQWLKWLETYKDTCKHTQNPPPKKKNPQENIFMFNDQGRIQDFKLGEGALKKIAPSGGRREHFGVFRVKNHDFTPKNHIFSNCGGRR